MSGQSAHSSWLHGIAERGGKAGVDNIDARALGRAADELDQLRLGLENARRDLFHLMPRADTGSRRKREIEAAIARIEAALNPDHPKGTP